MTNVVSSSVVCVVKSYVVHPLDGIRIFVRFHRIQPERQKVGCPKDDYTGQRRSRTCVNRAYRTSRDYRNQSVENLLPRRSGYTRVNDTLMKNESIVGYE